MYLPETLNLFLGHLLYTLIITGIAFFASAITDSSATAAIVALSFTLGSWILDFAASSPDGLLKTLSFISLTVMLRDFEHGLSSSFRVIIMLLVAAFLFGLTAIWLQPDSLLRKIKKLASVLIIVLMLGGIANQFSYYKDFTEDRRNSFNPAHEEALRQMEQPLHITLYLSPDDSRSRELERNVLAKLKRIVPDITVSYADLGQNNRYSSKNNEKYGLIVYRYNNRIESSRSNSPEEILPLLHRMAGHNVTPVKLPDYKGYPVVMELGSVAKVFYLAFPLFTITLWLVLQGNIKNYFRRWLP